MVYAEYFVHDLGRFDYLKKTGLNSHTRSMDRYERMLEAWEMSEDRYRLSQADLERILTARIHPSIWKEG